MDITGACHCGNVTWKAVANPEMVAVCYCTLSVIRVIGVSVRRPNQAR